MEHKDNPKLYEIRHSLAHVLAQAVQKKYPDVKLGFGPPVETGFYYDFDFGDVQINEKDLKDFTKQMKKIINQKQEFVRSEYTADNVEEAIADILPNETYKHENIRNLKERGVKDFTFYQNGPFIDLCEGLHVAHTGELPIKGFKLDSIAGAYWLGSEKNKQLTRIYGLAFETNEELRSYLERRQMAEKFDHKKLGKELGIFHVEPDLVGKGLILWLPNGTVIRDEIEKYAKEIEFRYGYKRVHTPHLTKAELYHTSQHLPAYEESMYPPMVLPDEDSDTKYYLKPMNCPHHHLIYGSQQHSYRDLPMRLAEYGTCYRFERSGELSGLIRVRCMTMNDAHIYLRLDQFEEEFKRTIQMYQELYDTFKLSEYSFRLSVRGKENSEKFKGDAAMWDKAEKLLAKVMDELGLDYFVGEGEGAFYGPKIDIQFKNLMGREETVSTIQVDFLSAQNFGLTFINEEGKEEVPVIIHRAPLSTHERFISFLLEYYGGAFPTWCSPIQVSIIPVAEDCYAYADALAAELTSDFMRVKVDKSSNSFNKKIRNNTVQKIPNMLIIGAKEVEEESVTLRRYGIKEQEYLSRADFIALLKQEIADRVMHREPMGSII